MGALMVVGFRGELRAAQVITEIRLLHREPSDDLDHAIVVARDQTDRLRVHQTLDPTAAEEAAWAGLWGSLISAALFVPVAGGLTTVACTVTGASRATAAGSSNRVGALPDARWWWEALSLPSDFAGDVAAILQRGCSAIFMLSRASDSPFAVQQLRQYNGTILRLSLSPEQEAHMSAVLGGSRPS